MTNKNNKEEKMNFESAIRRLEEIVSAMENGSAMLDESLSLFEEGVKLVKFCRGELDRAEQKVTVLQSDEKGELLEKPFSVEAE